MIKLSILLALTACGGKRDPAPGSATPGSAMARPDAVIAMARPDAAIAVARPDAAIATPVALAATRPVVIPDFGCVGWSQAQNLAACVVGHRGVNTGNPTSIAMLFVPLGERPSPPPIEVLELAGTEGRGPNDLPPAVANRLATQLAGFVTLDRSAHIGSSSTSGKLVTSPAIAIAKLTISVRSEPAPRTVIAPNYHTVLTVQLPDHTLQVLSDQRDAIGALDVRAYALRDLVVIEQVTSTGDEGIYGTTGLVWRCSAKGCDELQP